jgi:hypothetical protein
MRFLMCYDYGMGGFWWHVEAQSAAEVRAAFPHFTVFDSPPEWWGDGNRAGRVHEYKLGEPMDEYTQRLVADTAKHAADSGGN